LLRPFQSLHPENLRYKGLWATSYIRCPIQSQSPFPDRLPCIFFDNSACRLRGLQRNCVNADSNNTSPKRPYKARRGQKFPLPPDFPMGLLPAPFLSVRLFFLFAEGSTRGSSP